MMAGVVGSGGEPDDPVDLLDPDGQHGDVRVAERADLPARLDPVDSRQHQIEHDHIRVKLPRQRDRLLAVAGGCDSNPSRSK
jgi:hypothetical protein